VPEPEPEPGVQRVSSFYLVDNNTSEILQEIKEGDRLDLTKYGSRKLNIEARTSPLVVGSVRLSYDALPSRKENEAIYTVFNTNESTDAINESGSHRIYAEPYSDKNLNGQRGEGLERNYSVVKTSEPPAPEPGPTPTPEPGPAPGKEKSVTKTIVISKPGTYDFEGVMHVWKGGGSCIQKENQPHILRITASNVTVKNFYWRGAPDGVHVHCESGGQGNGCKTTLRNIKLVNFRGHACEDLMTTGPVENLEIIGGVFSENPNAKERDKTFQFNFGSPIIIRGARFNGGKRCIRAKGGAKRVEVHDSVFDGCQYPYRGDTAKDISGIPYGKEIQFISKNNTYKNCSRAFSAVDSRVKISSSGDTFQNCKKQ